MPRRGCPPELRRKVLDLVEAGRPDCRRGAGSRRAARLGAAVAGRDQVLTQSRSRHTRAAARNRTRGQVDDQVHGRHAQARDRSSPACVAEPGTVSVHAVPLRLRREIITALNLFGHQPGPLPSESALHPGLCTGR